MSFKKISTFMIALILVITISSTSYVMAETKEASKVITKTYKTKYKIYITENGNKVYYYQGALYKKLSGKYIKITKLKVSPSYIVSYGNYIYFTNNKGKMCRIKYNGKGERNYNTKVGKIENVINDYIYFTLPQKGALYRIGVKSKKKEKVLTAKSVNNRFVTSDNIIYCNNNNDKFNSAIFISDLNGNNKKLVYSWDNNISVKVAINGDSLFILNSESNVEELLIYSLKKEKYKCLSVTISDQLNKLLNDKNNSCTYLGVFRDKLYLLVNVDGNSDIIISIDSSGIINKVITLEDDVIIDDIIMKEYSNCFSIASNKANVLYYYNYNGILIKKEKIRERINGIKYIRYIDTVNDETIKIYYRAKNKNITRIKKISI